MGNRKRPRRAAPDPEFERVEALYRTMRSRDLRLLYSAFAIDRAEAGRHNPTLVVFASRRLRVISRILAERRRPRT